MSLIIPKSPGSRSECVRSQRCSVQITRTNPPFQHRPVRQIYISESKFQMPPPCRKNNNNSNNSKRILPHRWTLKTGCRRGNTTSSASFILTVIVVHKWISQYSVKTKKEKKKNALFVWKRNEVSFQHGNMVAIGWPGPNKLIEEHRASGTQQNQFTTEYKMLS